MYWPYGTPVIPRFNRVSPYPAHALEEISAGIVDQEHPDFARYLGLSMAYVGAQIVQSLSNRSRAFRQEFQVIKPAICRFYQDVES